MRIAICTLGCRTNQAESAGMAELLRLRGHEVLPPLYEGGKPDAIVINTCTVTATADKKSRNVIRKLQKQYPDALLAVCGCLPQTETLDIDGIGLIGGTSGRVEFIEALEDALRGNHPNSPPWRGGREADGVVIPAYYDDTLPDARPIGRSRAYIKIQDGCDNACSYCKVPQARGKARSRPVESVIRAAKEAAEGGAVEIVLTGIEISSFQPSLADVTVSVCRAAAPVSVRLSSLHPDTVDDRFAAALKGEGNFRPAFHLSLQSCCDQMLKAMGRRYTVNDIINVFNRLRDAWQRVEITADIIVGFPGESEEDFEKTLETLQKLNPDGLHIFPYSRRKGTPAAELPGQLTRAVKAERARRLNEAFPKG
ncbi:MAG: MiaB/RimO family radical SAM methylthiotransferase [Oscillospiraceae bacterium]|nr:MiaB/RimO family radical SAM methylthiotransferase [Oscillospiraceae bacterium]